MAIFLHDGIWKKLKIKEFNNMRYEFFEYELYNIINC